MKKLARYVRVLFWPLFFVSLLFPILAGFRIIGAENRLAGYLDVFIAFLLFACLVVIQASFPGMKKNAVQQYKTASGVILLAVAVYFLFPERFLWDVLLIGLGWRLWLLFQVLPHDLRV